MVALTPRFAVLGAFVSLASFSLAPLSAGAVAIHKSTTTSSTQQENSNKARFATWPPVSGLFRLAQLKAKKRHHHEGEILDIDIPNLIEIEVGRKRSEQQHFHSRRTRILISDKHGASYYVSPSRKHRKHRGRVHRRDHSGVEGVVDIMSPDSGVPNGKKIGSLEMVPMSDGTYVLDASEKNATHMYLVNAPSPSRAQSKTPSDADADVPVMLQVEMYDASSETAAPIDFCTTYQIKASDAAPLTLQKCVFNQPNEEASSETSQVFSYNEKTGVLRPFWFKPAPDDQTNDSAQRVLERGDAAPAQNVTLMFVPSAPQAANVQDTTPSPSANAVTSTSTLTTTVTVTGTPLASVSAADVMVTSSVEPSPSSTDAALTSTANVPAPTAASAGALDVQVVGPPSSSASVIATSEAAAAPTTTINAQDIASSIAASSSAPASAMDASLTVTSTASVNAPSSTVSPSAAALDDATASTSTESSAAPTMTPLNTEPYKWVFRRD